MRHRSLSLFFLSLGIAAGCGEDYAPYNRLTGLRVLVIKSEPPTPAPGETATLSALVYEPRPMEETVSHEWSWCPFEGPANDGYPCLVDQAQLSALVGGAPVPPLQLGTAPEATFVQSIPQESLAALCDRNPETNVALGPLAKYIDCTGGLGVSVKLVVRTKNKAGEPTDEVISRRTLRLRFGQIEPNANPTMEGIAAGVEKKPVDDANTAGVTLVRNVESPIGVKVDPAQSETYLGRDDDLRPATVREKLIFSWFVESGDLKYGRTSYIVDQTMFDIATSNKWKPDIVKDYAPGTAKVMVVIRDDRGGASWRTGIVNLAVQP